MNAIRSTQALNKRELENAVPPSASWHTDYRDTAYIYIGGLPFDLSEGDIVTIFSQYGEPTHINLIRDKETGKSKGFAFLKYEDQKSTDLAVDNLGGATVLGRLLRVDHTRYKRKEGKPGEDSEEEDNIKVGKALNAGERNDKDETGGEIQSQPPRPLLKEERELADLLRDHDEEDPMKEYLIQQKKEEVANALAKLEGGKKHKHHHHRERHGGGTDKKSHRDRNRQRRSDEEEEEEGERDSGRRRHGEEARRHGDEERKSKPETRDRRLKNDTDDEGKGRSYRKEDPKRRSRSRERDREIVQRPRLDGDANSKDRYRDRDRERQGYRSRSKERRYT